MKPKAKAALAKAAASARKTNPASKKSRSSKRDVSASSAAVLAKANASSTAQPGIIASIINCLTEAKAAKTMLTVEEIVAKLTKLFPERNPTGMTTTVRAQLSRLPHEKEFQIRSLRDGRRVRYVAA